MVDTVAGNLKKKEKTTHPQFKNLINNEWVDSLSNKTFENRNPSKQNQVLGLFPRSQKEDVDQAVKTANEAYKKWKNVPPPERGEILFRAGEIMSARKQELAEILSAENGKTVAGALGDVQSAIDMAYFAGGEGRRLYGKTSHSGLPKRFAMTKRFPIGVMGIITSWNFPMAIAAWKTFPALLCGNSVVLKSEENTPETTVHFAQILKDAGIPKGVFNLIHGFGPESGEALTCHPLVGMISFTGSSATGKIIGKHCADRLAKVSLELGGKNGILVMEDADIEAAVKGTVCGAFAISGQRCTATSRVVVHEKIYDLFLENLLNQTAQLKVGPGCDPASEVTPLISKKQFDRVLGFIDRAKQQGAKIEIGGKPLKGNIYDQGYYIEPTVITQVSPEMEIAQEEIFGPVLIVFKTNSYEEAIQIHNNNSYGLAASLFTKDIDRAFSFFDSAEAGVCYINAPTFGSEPHMPFGGVKQSGLGYREAGWAAIEAFSEVKTLYVDYSTKIQNVQFSKPQTDE